MKRLIYILTDALYFMVKLVRDRLGAVLKGSSQYMKSIVLTVMLLVYLVLAGPVSAILVQVTGVPDTVSKGDPVPFNISIKIDPVEKLPLMYTRVVFNASGEDYDGVCLVYNNLSSNCSYIDVLGMDYMQSLQYGYGVGYGYDYGYGSYLYSGFGYGYGYNDSSGNITIRLRLNTTGMPVGAASLKAEVVSGNSSDSHVYASSVVLFSIACAENWSYGAWGACSCATRTRARTGADLNSCGTTINRTLVESCVPTGCGGGGGGSLWGGAVTILSGGSEDSGDEMDESAGCAEAWECTEWSACSAGGMQKRACVDVSKCGTTENKPLTSRACKYKAPEAEIADGTVEALFDINVELTEEEVTSDGELMGKVTLINFGDEGSVDANLYYAILDSEGNVVYEGRETVAVETQKEFIKTFDVSDFASGEYTLVMDLEYAGQSEPAKTERVFSVEGEEDSGYGAIVWIIVAVLAVACLCAMIYKFREIIIYSLRLLHERLKSKF